MGDTIVSAAPHIISSATPQQRKILKKLGEPSPSVLSELLRSDRTQSVDQNRCSHLREVYFVFTLHLHSGMYLMQFFANASYGKNHHQLTDDLDTLKVDPLDGRIVEFPLSAISRLGRFVKLNTQGTGSKAPSSPRRPEHIVIVEFTTNMLVFVFNTPDMASCFLLCMALLALRAKELNQDKTPLGVMLEPSQVAMPASELQSLLTACDTLIPV